MNQSKDTRKWKASIKVDLTAVNQYGDLTGDGYLSYSVSLEGALAEIVQKLESLKTP